MFNLNENNRIVMAQQPTDMRKGVNTLCGQVRLVGLDPADGKVYIFVGTSRKVMKILHWEHGGYVVDYKRLEQGRFHPRIFLREGSATCNCTIANCILHRGGVACCVLHRAAACLRP